MDTAHNPRARIRLVSYNWSSIVHALAPNTCFYVAVIRFGEAKTTQLRGLCGNSRLGTAPGS